MIAQVARTYSISPLQAARELDDDPEQLALVCIPLLGYARVKAAFDEAKGDPDRLKPWAGSKALAMVEDNTFELRRVRMDRRSRGED